ncbi:MAG: ABC transporter ATP-binding protein [Alphaproteobacteria bacterium]|nr:MAG: ABC transporter ATP-binding protein [Alphaproteobacteria bacterium]
MTTGQIRRDGLRVVSSGTQQNPDNSRPAPQDLAIQVSGAQLDYPLGAFARGSIKSSLLSLLGQGAKERRPVHVTALRGLDFRIAFGERVGLIGHNGSGKSSLLRVLAGVYPLAAGDVTVTGRIGTLLDIGLGFETESTGRENIYFRGLAMGVSRARMAEVEEEIVRFADLGEFIDMPMRTYSAGMYVRLGFAISTQFAPDILLVDEVFGAGDATFAKRALQRMTKIVENSGIFVMATHDLPLVEKICTRVIWMEHGQVFRDGPPSVVVPEYLRRMAT